MATPNIRIDIASEFKDRGFKQAQRSSSALEKSFKRLAATFLTVFSVRAITQFGKASVKAFSEDQKAAQRLTGTLKNLGLAYENPQAKAFLAQLEQTSGVLDDDLRPAFGRLIQQTRSFTESQKLLTLAVDVAAGSGYDLSTVVNDLSRAYVGQTRGLTKYNIGLTAAELKTTSFVDLQERLNTQFSGQRAAYLETYAGKVDLLRVGYANMTEEIGKGLVDAFDLLSGDAGIAGASRAMVDFGTTAGDVLRGIASLVPQVRDDINRGFSTESLLREMMMQGDPFGAILYKLQQRGRRSRPLQFASLGVGEPALTKLREQQEADRIKREKELAALQKKAALEAAKREKERLRREREAQALKRAGTVFDMENIQIVAAMQGEIDAQQRLRLVALLAINTDNAQAAEEATRAVLALNAASLKALGITIEAGDNTDAVIGKLLAAQAKIALVGLGIANLPKAKNPFEDWDAIIKQILADLAKIQAGLNFKPGTTATVPPAPVPTPAVTPSIVAPVIVPPSAQVPITDDFPYGNIPSVVPDFTPLPIITPEMQAMQDSTGLDNPYIVNVTVQGSVMTQQDLTNAILDNLYQFQGYGRPISYNIATV